MPRRNRVDPWGDLVAHPARGLFTGNRGCVVDDHENVVRHHGTNLLWITCQVEFRDWRVGLARPRRWTPLFFLDDAVALAAGHRPCSTCRRFDYVAYRNAVSDAAGARQPLSAADLNVRLSRERLNRGRGLDRAADRKLWRAPLLGLPPGAVVLDGERRPCLWDGDVLQPFGFEGWGSAVQAPDDPVDVLTPPTSVAALSHGFAPVLHPSASRSHQSHP
ncbi:hypothetical protein N802_13570 [Knoellia sinensis KCTC 19936]|uniref:Uncharacterized protein n=1 Tax=Knoellia sinensis KCTC 19936 TaxID=1385520 RepID=A0A0A0JA90_9MICO|nr:hypothetical protein [Knoellia sinensis]KGN34365.1 hypothetical protein N802_13570 [Knoellia sinensis KCTC 19936]